MGTNFTPQDRPHTPAGPVVAFDTWCVTCGYNLVRLPKGGTCPACGTPIEQTLTSNLLSDSSPEHVATLHKGVSLALNSILVGVAIGLVFIVAAMFQAVTTGFPAPPTPGAPQHIPTQPLWLIVGFSILNLAVYSVYLYGLWLFSTSDPAVRGWYARAESRAWIRRLVPLVGGLMALQMIAQPFIQSVMNNALQRPGGFIVNPTLVIIWIVSAIAAIPWLALYFVQLLYVRWLAPRFPDRRIAVRAKLMLWLGPLLCTLGTCVCGLGPLAAIILYWNLLNQVRQDLKYLLDHRTYDDHAANLTDHDPSV